MRVKTEAKREAILAAASEAFLASGFEGASMSGIAGRVGGSKATLYGYFKSKDELFIAVINDAASKQFRPIFAALDRDTHALPEALQRFGESTLEFLCTEAAIQMQRAIIAEAGRSDIGLRFFEMGPQKARHDLAHFLEGQMALGRLRRADPLLVAIQLIALLECETVTPCLFGVVQRLSKAQIRQAVQRALGTFLAAHGTAAMAGPPPPPAS